MNILTNNLVLRAIEKQDNALLLQLINDPETERMLGGWSFPSSSAHQENWFSSIVDDPATLRCILAEKERPEKAIGTVILSDIDMKNGTAEIHIKLAESGRGKGYGSEAITALVQYSFSELRIHCIYARVNDYNEASKRLFKKCGFEEEGVLRDRFYKSGRYVNVLSFSIINGEL